MPELEAVPYTCQYVTLNPGDTLILYTKHPVAGERHSWSIETSQDGVDLFVSSDDDPSPCAFLVETEYFAGVKEDPKVIKHAHSADLIRLTPNSEGTTL